MNGSTARVGWMLAAPLLLVNSAAIWGQAGWAHDHITEAGWPSWVGWAVAALFAVAVESVGVFLAGMAHAALMADQSAATLRLGSYLVGALVGTLNYWHFAGDGFRPTAQAVAFGALSSISPWLWAVYSRYRNRDRLAELGQIDKRGVKLSTSRKFWHPLKSVSVIRYASWEGIVEPDEAVKAWTMARKIDSLEEPLAPVTPLRAVAEPETWIPREPAQVDEDETFPHPVLREGRVDPWAFSRDLRLVKPPSDDALDRAMTSVLSSAPTYPPAEPANGRHWTQPTEADQSYGATDFVQTPAMREELGDPVDPVFQEPQRPASDEHLLAVYDLQLHELHTKGKLNRYQVEQLTKAGRRQAERLIEHIETNWDRDHGPDQVSTMVNGSKDVT